MISLRKNRIIIAVSVLFCIVIAAVIVILLMIGKNIQDTYIDVYFYNEQKSIIVPEARYIKYTNPDEIAGLVIDDFLRGPESRDNIRMVKVGTKMIGFSNNGLGDVLVNFSQEYLTDDATDNMITTYAVIKTLCGVDGIERVKVLVEGNEIQKPNGDAIGYLASRDINLPTDKNSEETREIVLYFGCAGGKLAKETRSIKVTDQQPLEQYIIYELIKGPMHNDHTAVLNKDTSVMSVKIIDDICFVNFKSSFLEINSGSEEKEQQAIYSIVNSLTELGTFSKVQFLMDGKKAETFGNLDIGDLFMQNLDIVRGTVPQQGS